MCKAYGNRRMVMSVPFIIEIIIDIINFKFVDVISMDNLLIRQNYAKLKINIGTYFI